MTRLKAILHVEVEYDAPPELYGGVTDPEELADIDRKNFAEDVIALMETASQNGGSFETSVEVKAC